MKKTAKEKLAYDKGLPKVEKIKPNQQKRLGKGTIVIPAPKEVDNLMRKVPKGKLITINRIREKLAKKHHATTACPICCGIFSNLSAQSAEEDRQQGKGKITPWWRTVKEKGILNPKYPGGNLNQKKLIEKEGHNIKKKGKNYIVEDFEKKLVR